MSKISDRHPEVGTRVQDTERDREGVVMGPLFPTDTSPVMLRPVGGGKEWQAAPGNLRIVEGKSHGA
ncbi:hypothetical protein E1283_23085 [Streptomyces hainanensis]|uniref:Uncharacterized protein n=1 Tax=Streptomyces hainanensis TaxID=402648 RepID=A0A4R4TBS6_9ACTN|nr:hypothetical protein E1283_23085 [Streptomyces hainanensis]